MTPLPKRLPKGYLGLNHETLGSDVISLVQAITVVDQLLGKAKGHEIRTMKPDGWYPINMLLDALEAVEVKLGTSSLKKVGWTLFNLSHGDKFKATARAVRDLAYGIDGMYHHANRGTHIGGWQVLEFVPGRAVIEKTTPHHCIMEEGILEEGLRILKVPALVSQETCFRQGADSCRFVISSHVRDARWG